MKSKVALEGYRKLISLDEIPLIDRRNDWRLMIHPVLSELDVDLPKDAGVDLLVFALHGKLAEIEPFTLSKSLLDKIETIAFGINDEGTTSECLALPRIAERYQTSYPAKEQTVIWVGDITKLKVDVIVNAANSYLLGCRLANHACIDNAIHSAAGPRLRDDCEKIIASQQQLEPVGTAKITRAYALPAKFVLHTVGPQLMQGAQPTDEQVAELRNSYLACLDLSAQIEGIRTIAFCAISTGVFGYPKVAAAKIAMNTVAEWLGANTGRFDRIVFNLYSSQDASIYEELLNEL